MGRKSLIARELEGVPLETLYREAMTGDGVSSRAAVILDGQCPIVLMLAIGVAAQPWQEVIDEYHAQQAHHTPDSAESTGEGDGV